MGNPIPAKKSRCSESTHTYKQNETDLFLLQVHPELRTQWLQILATPDSTSQAPKLLCNLQPNLIGQLFCEVCKIGTLITTPSRWRIKAQGFNHWPRLHWWHHLYELTSIVGGWGLSHLFFNSNAPWWPSRYLWVFMCSKIFQYTQQRSFHVVDYSITPFISSFFCTGSLRSCGGVVDLQPWVTKFPGQCKTMFMHNLIGGL